MFVLLACEESQRCCLAFRKKGHLAFSCDIEPESGGFPEWHICSDVVPLLGGGFFTTSDNVQHFVPKWDLIIAFPPCTYLSVAGNRHFSLRCNSFERVHTRLNLRDDAFQFVLKLASAPCDRIAIENPVGYLNTHYRVPDQIIHPYFFGDPFMKKTCLWLKNLPLLHPTNLLSKPSSLYFRGAKAIGWVEGISGTTGGQKGRAKARSKTFPGIASAMAEQWG